MQSASCILAVSPRCTSAPFVVLRVGAGAPKSLPPASGFLQTPQRVAWWPGSGTREGALAPGAEARSVPHPPQPLTHLAACRGAVRLGPDGPQTHLAWKVSGPDGSGGHLLCPRPSQGPSLLPWEPVSCGQVLSRLSERGAGCEERIWGVTVPSLSSLLYYLLRERASE